MKKIALLSLLAISVLPGQEFTKGLGMYPGNPKEDFAPAMVPDTATYRNLAFRRPAYHSSSSDYNQTAQLVTDGIKESYWPRAVAVSTSGPAPAAGRGGRNFGLTAAGEHPWVQYEFTGGAAAPEIDRIEIATGGPFGRGQAAAAPAQPGPGSWSIVVSGSDDGQGWKELGKAAGDTAPPVPLRQAVAFTASARNRFLRIALESPGVGSWRIGEVKFFRQNERVYGDAQHDLSSVWIPAGRGEEWVYVDLGAACTFDRVALNWLQRPAAGSLQVSDDGTAWRTLQVLPAGQGATDEIRLPAPAKARYVRVLITQPGGEAYGLSELEVWGRGGFAARAQAAPGPEPNGRLHLAGGAWRLQRATLVTESGAKVSTAGFADKDWVAATVPATVLSSYLNIGALPDPNFGDNQLQISDSFFCSDFWYRDEFTAPPAVRGRHVWLNFDGINWKAEVYLNGSRVGDIEGGFMRGRFDVTGLLRPGVRNGLAVRVKTNATPGPVKVPTMQSTGSNGGPLGADNPTYHASAGWDWMPTIRGRNMGIWADVYLTGTGGVSIEDPFVNTTLPLPDVSRAEISVEATLVNHDRSAASGTLRGRFGPARFEMPVTIEAGASRTVKFDPANTPSLRLQNPKLWWPVGYGDPNLYDVELTFRRRRATRCRTRSPSRRACGSSPSARRGTRCACGSTDGDSCRAAEAGASPNRTSATGRANTTRPSAITRR